MLPEQQQRIMGYFIEEAKDHLNTIEQGLLNLQATIADPEMANEVFRAAHSVKGGAAMLGIESMQRASHRLEDYFKILKDSPVQVDRVLETMCLQVFDALQELLEQLQGPFGLTEDKAQEIMVGVEPVFEQLDRHLNGLVAQSAIAAPAASTVQQPVSRSSVVVTSHTEQSALELVFKSDVPSYLREMLNSFKQRDSQETRQRLQEVCSSLSRLGEQFDLNSWCDLIKTVSAAIASPDNTYRALAPVVIKDLKQGQGLVLAGRAAEVSVSEGLQQLLPEDVLPLDESAALEDLLEDSSLSDDSDFGDLFGDAAEPVDSLDMDDAADFLMVAQPSLGGALDDLGSAAALPPDLAVEQGHASVRSAATHIGPEVGAAELNSLADLFEGDMNALDTTWQEEVAEDISLEDTNALDVDISNDFSDLLVEPPIHESRQGLSATEDLGMLFGDDAADFSQPDAADADMSDLLDMFDDETDESLLSEPEAENNLTAMTASTAAMDAPGFDELNDFFDEFEGDDVVSLTPVADSSRAIADDSDRPGFDDMFAASATDEIGSRAASLEAEVESDSLFDASEVTESFETPIAAGSFSLDDNLSSDPWSEDTSFSSPVSQDSPENPSFFQPEEIGDPWGGGSETQAFLEIETPTGGSEPNAVLNDLLEETQIAEADLPDLSSDFFTESVADEDLDSDDWQFADENALIESLDETADFDFDLSGFESPVTSGSDPEASDDFNDPLLEDPLQLSQELEVLDDSSSGSEDLSLVMDSLEIPDSADEEPGIDSTGIDIETGEIADPFAAGAELSSPMLSANSAEADSAGLSSPEVSLDVLELEDSEDNFSSIFEEDIESEEIQLTAASENFSELLHQAENLSALETDDADVDEDFAGLFGADDNSDSEAEISSELDALDFDQAENLSALETDDADVDEDFAGLFGAGDSSDNEAEISSELDTLDFGAIASEASATDNDLDRLSGDEWALSDLEGWQEPESDPSEFDSLLDDSLDSLDETASGPDVLDTLALDDLDDPDDLTQSETISTDLDSLFDEPFDLEADSTPTDLSTAEELEVDLWDVPAASARGELEEITGHDDADTELWADLTAPENSGSQDDWLEAEPTETSGWANETDLSREPFDSDLPETDPDDDFDLAVSADSTAIAVAESIFDADDALAADLTAAADADGLEEPGFAAEVGGDTDSTDDAVLFEAQFEQNQIDTAEESFADLDFLLEEPDSQLELDQTLIADMTEADLDSEDLATSITLTELTDGLLEPAAEMSVETQDEADFSDLEALLDLEDSEDPEDPATSEPRADTDNDDFDDLEALLDDSAAEASPNTAVGQPLTEMTASDADDFSDLEALLDVEAEVSAPALATPETLSTADFEENSNEFEDLERLLEEADQTLGGGTSASSRSTPQRSRRPARRGGSVLGDQTMRVSVNHLDNLSNLVGELVVNRNTLEQDQERLRQFLDNLMSQVQQLNDVGQRIRDLYERSLLESSLISSRQSYQMSGNRRSEDKSSHSTGATFDALEMDRFTGFHTLSQEMIELIVRVRESASDIGYTIESSDQVTRQFRQVTTQLQEGLNKARMVPFAQTADRLPRAVRDISVKCGKEARLVVEGRDTLIDKMILEQLYDPMTHLVNNAITHGVELPEVRSAQGKPPEGQITVRAFYQGNQTVIYVADDGAGIDAELVKKKAVQKGLILPAEAGHLSIHDVYELLFHPGFSTRDQADDFAGRGVGMDVVRTYLSQIRGNITIDSEIGKGTSFTIRLPLTLSISKALTCISNQARIAFPMDGVEDMLDIPKERVQENDQGQTCIFWRDTLLPFQPLSDLLQFNRTLGRGRIYGGNQDDEVISIVILRSATTHIALQVDQVIGEQEIVIKQLEGPVPKPMGIAGATVLGDGRVMPIADVLELIDLSMGRVRREPNASLWGQLDETTRNVAAEPPKTEPTVLIVDDSITVRELLSMSFNKVGYRVEQARDGQEAWEKLRSGLPCDLVFCDIEMPRMDGLELLSRMQKDPSLSEIPIAMLTSRGADRHRQMAVDLGASGYFTKPYLEEVLLDAAQRMLNGETFAGGRSDTVST